ncbi:MAG: ATP-binding protein [Lachnospiraceae bacterium]|nr:ATP-binding protein [Lachnospiraceae bacterium]MDO5550619.1 ATP-binding protein [Lachnospiraceae bacterium]
MKESKTPETAKQFKKQKNDQKSFWIMGLIFSTILFLFGYLGGTAWKGYKEGIIDQQKEQMLLTVQSMGFNLRLTIQEYMADLEGLCQTEKRYDMIRQTENWEILDDYTATHAPYVWDVVLEDQDGTIIRSSKGGQIISTSTQMELSETIRLSQSKMENGSSYLVVQKQLRDGRSLAIILDEEVYYQNLISGIRLGTNGYALVKDSKGVIMMHPDRKQWGIETISGRQELYPGVDLKSLENMLDSQLKGEEDILEYYSYWWTSPDLERVKKISAYTPVQMGKDFLVVSAVMDYDDIYVPIVSGIYKMILICIGFLGSVLLLGIYLYRMAAQSKKDKAEILYLQELNRILQKMHQSEETIAHQQRLQIMGTMTGGIAHEFNNLLTPIMGYADLLLMELPEDSEAYEEAAEIYEASAKAKELIQQISSLSRKNMETAFKNIVAAQIFRRAFKMVRSVCPANVVFEEQLELEGQCMLGNETQLNQVILNICVNAIHAIGRKEDGRVRITGAVVGREELERWELSSIPDTWKHYIKLAISDNGCGMTREVMDQIFNPFFTTKENGKGTGLGLALAEQIIHSHKGYIFVESTVGAGSTFYLYFPVNEQKVQEEEIHGPDGEELRLLVADDNAKVLKLLERNFAKLGVSADFCMNFEEAGKLLKEKKYDAMAAEQAIQGRSAVDFFMAIQGRYPELIKIVMADYITRELAEAKDRKVIDEYIDKPVSDAAILGAVKRGRADWRM